ncbi:hypothetical protein NX059_007487 [Plenodomus lindquistii]|nr:hypothetical protein NX059_007487 [Plenodomus lindquistii]
MPKSSTLSLAMRGKAGKESTNAPMSPKSPKSPSIPEESDFAMPHASFHKMPQSPASPKPRKDSKNIFSNFAASRSSSRLNSQENTTRQPAEQHPSPGLYSNGRSGSSTPDLGRPVRTPNSDDNRSEILRLDQRTGSGLSNDPSDPHGDPSKRNTIKPKKPGLLSRSKSIKGDDASSTRTKLNKAPPAQLSPELAGSWTNNGDGMQLRTAPIEKGQSWRQNMGIGKLRTHSADRQDGSKHVQREDEHVARRDRAEQVSLASSSYNDKGPGLISSLGSGARKMGEKMDSARKGVFGKLGRSSSNHESQTSISNEPYICKIIHKPLIEQTRLTRISTRLEQSRDKTEFWMPALPWRCIDYLNMRGCEEEGLYRVPGSAQQVRYYERKFDEDRDIDLISDPNLNDPNVIGSLFKNWLRQLPDEIFPKAIQAAIQQECQGAKSTPQMLKDELSKLPPFNYYLLFAITCHISLLHSCSEFNKMNYNNLCICFQPAIKIDAFCFQFLILDWRNCWQGCWTEKDFLNDELDFLSAVEMESQQQQQQQQQLSQQQQQHPPTRNGHAQISRNKSSQPASYVGQPPKPTSTRSNSTDHMKSSIRTLSMDTNGRAIPSNSSIVLSDATQASVPRARSGHGENSPERYTAVSDSRDEHVSRDMPQRGLSAVTTELPIETDEDATPTQAQHGRGLSDSTQFRLDLRDPPGSPFNIKF